MPDEAISYFKAIKGCGFSNMSQLWYQILHAEQIQNALGCFFAKKS